jgi:hypothetical protein
MSTYTLAYETVNAVDANVYKRKIKAYVYAHGYAIKSVYTVDVWTGDQDPDGQLNKKAVWT